MLCHITIFKIVVRIRGVLNYFKNKATVKSISLNNYFPEEIKDLVNWANEALDSKQAIVTKISQDQYSEIRKHSDLNLNKNAIQDASNP
jgi:hypothetical protein